MSLFGALFTGVSALSAQSSSLSTISNNIANVNTNGYKALNTDFFSLVTTTGSGAAYNPGGVHAATIGTQDQQGVLQQTNSATDIALSGNGYFVTRTGTGPTDDVLYTRAGSFKEDSDGYLRNTAGNVLMGWTVDANGNIPASNADLSSLSPVNVSFVGGLTSATSTITAGINLDATQVAQASTTVANATATPPTLAATPDYSREVTVYDSLGNAQKLVLQYYKHNPADTDTTFAAQSSQLKLNSWYLQVRKDSSTGAIVTNPTPLVFGGGDGKLTVPAAPGTVSLPNVNWGNGSKTQTMSLDVNNVTQFSSAYNVVSITQNGAALGLLSNINIDEDGYVFANFTNGQTQKLYKVAVATFTNPNGLEEKSGNSYLPTTQSGAYNLREAGNSGAAKIASSSLEKSNVDLAEQFSNMIVTQRAYSAATKVISTSDSMLQDLISSIR